MGVDQLLARFLGRVEHATLSHNEEWGPTVVLTIQGVDWPLTFPKPLLMESADVRLRSRTRLDHDRPVWRGLAVQRLDASWGFAQEMCRDLLH
ncbi:MAG: hypothetical protein IPJ98_28620 [Bryobacterales bacterium]|nr:hypothetical protein [Bryobacterales bacterium]